MPLSAMMNWLVPRDDKFFLLLEHHGEALGEAAQVMAAFVEERVSPRDSLDGIHRIEHQGDDLVHAVTVALDETYVTPIDREDLHSLASSLDSVLDYLYRAIDAFVTYEVHSFTQAMRDLVRLCTEAAQVLNASIPQIRKRRVEKLGPARLQIVALEKRGDTVYRDELAALFKDPRIDAKELLRQKAVLDALEAALDSCQDAADVLENVAIKHA